MFLLVSLETCHGLFFIQSHGFSDDFFPSQTNPHTSWLTSSIRLGSLWDPWTSLWKITKNIHPRGPQIPCRCLFAMSNYRMVYPIKSHLYSITIYIYIFFQIMFHPCIDYVYIYIYIHFFYLYPIESLDVTQPNSSPKLEHLATAWGSLHDAGTFFNLSIPWRGDPKSRGTPSSQRIFFLKCNL